MSIGSANDAPSARVIRQFGRASSYGTRIAGPWPVLAVIGRVHCGPSATRGAVVLCEALPEL